MIRCPFARLLVAVLALGGCGRTSSPVGKPQPARDGGAEVAGDASAAGSHRADAGVDALPPLDFAVANRPGELVDLDQILVPGKVTVIDFWADWCGACKLIDEKLVELVTGLPGVAVRKVDILDDDSPVARHYDIGVLPHLRIYTAGGELAYALIGDNAERIGESLLEVLARE